jgi:hypothetical protein
VSKSARMLGFIKRISREFNDPYRYKTLYVAFVQSGWSWRIESVYLADLLRFGGGMLD